MIYHTNGRDDESYSLVDLDEECKATCRALKDHLNKFDVIVVTGLSGIVPGVAASLKLKVPLAILRKPDDTTHQMGGLQFDEPAGGFSYWVGGESVKGRRCLWIDDFSATGRTAKRITQAVEDLGGKVVAEYLTRDGEFNEL